MGLRGQHKEQTQQEILNSNGSGGQSDKQSRSQVDGRSAIRIESGSRQDIARASANEVKKTDSNETGPPRAPFKFAGYLAQLLEVLIAALVLLCLKLLPVENSQREKAKAAMFRGAFLALFCGVHIIQRGHSFKVASSEFWINFWRCSFGALYALLNFIALKYITMGECTAIAYSSTIWTCLLGFLLLGEPLPLSLILALPICLLGIVLLSKPELIVDPRQGLASELDLLAGGNSTASPNTNELQLVSNELVRDGAEAALLDQVDFEQRWPGILIALVSSLVLSLVIVILKLRKTTPILTCSFYLGSTTVLVSVVGQLAIGFGSFSMSVLECSLHLAIGVLSYAEQLLFQWSLQLVPAGTFSIIQTLEIVVGFILGAVFLHDVILWTSVLGSVLIICVVVMLILDERLVRCLGWKSWPGEQICG